MPRLQISPALSLESYSSYSPFSPLSTRFPYSPTSPQSPVIPFLIPPQHHSSVTTFFKFAKPLLPASPLSIFDRAISPTSMGAISSPESPSHPHTFLEAALPRVDQGKAWNGLTPTFLWPGTPPAVPNATQALLGPMHLPARHEETDGLKERHISTGALIESKATRRVETMHVERSRMRMDFYHLLAVKRAAALDEMAVPRAARSKARSAKKPWKKMFSQKKNDKMTRLQERRSWLSLWSEFRSRVRPFEASE